MSRLSFKMSPVKTVHHPHTPSHIFVGTLIFAVAAGAMVALMTYIAWVVA